MKSGICLNIFAGLLLALGTGTGRLHGEEALTHPFCGVTLISRTETVPRVLSIHVALIDLTAPGLRFKLKL